MAQYHHAKAIVGNYSVSLDNELKKSILEANRIEMVVSFIMESGVNLLLDPLKQAIQNGTKIKIITGTYMNITQPSAIYKLKQAFNNQVEIYFYNSKEQSFHPKAYFFHYDQYDEVYVGSSNLSYSALTNGVEWNYRFTSIDDQSNYQFFFQEYKNLYTHSILVDDLVLKDYSNHWKKSAIEKEQEKYIIKRFDKIEPRGVQIEALYHLESTRKEGAKKALIHAATGIGKTYLAAFDSKKYKKVLFVAHREEILKQAAHSFKTVRPEDTIGFFNGDIKDTNCNILMASVSSLGKEEYLNSSYFQKDDFDYIVIDEFHHAVNQQYINIINYFQPQFMLGLTATPERLDGRNIYALCDYNVPYEINLKDAINKGILCPFHYYGIYDDLDYSIIPFVAGKYNEKDLEKLYIGNHKRMDLIIQHYHQYPISKTIAFCSSRNHALEMSRYFNENNIPSCAVFSNAKGEYTSEREEAIEKLIQNKIKVLFCVDMFNEGVDIPSIDSVMFLRPTISPTIFLQQLGRGLRKDEGKQYLTVLDFIGNYKKANFIPSYLSNNYNISSTSISKINFLDYPDECIVNFDFQLIDIFVKMTRATQSVDDKIHEGYLNVKERVGHIPSRVELFEYLDEDVYQLAIQSNRLLRKYLDYLEEWENIHFDDVVKELIQLIDTTSMSKSYKMPILQSFIEGDSISFKSNESQLLDSWKQYYQRGIYWKDLSYSKDYSSFNDIPDKKHISNIKNNPVKFLIKSSNGVFFQEDGFAICLNEKYKKYQNNQDVIQQIKDATEFRTLDYFKRRYKEDNGVQ